MEGVSPLTHSMKYGRRLITPFAALFAFSTDFKIVYFGERTKAALATWLLADHMHNLSSLQG